VLKAEQISDELKITWDLNDGVARDPAEFTALTALSSGFLPKRASYYFLGKRSAPLLEWKALITSLQPLLERRVKLRFVCSAQKIANWLKEMGVGLLGEVTCDPAAGMK